MNTLDDFNDIINNTVTINNPNKTKRKYKKRTNNSIPTQNIIMEEDVEITTNTITSNNLKKNKTNKNKKEKQLSTIRIARQPNFTQNMIRGEHVELNTESTNYAIHVLPKRNVRCQYCSALMWFDEKTSNSSKKSPKFGLCCLSGQVNLDKEIKLPDMMNQNNSEYTLGSIIQFYLFHLLVLK